jgi:hypothetical protein
MAPGGCGQAASGRGVKSGVGACEIPWRRAREKRFPALFCWILWGEAYPAGHHGPRRWKISGGRAAPDPGQCRQCCRIGAGLELEGRHLVLLVADAQCEVVQGAANVGAVVERRM